MEIQGRIEAIMDTNVVSSNFRKREFVIRVDDDANGRTYTNYIKLEMTQDNCDKLDGHNVNSLVKVSYNNRGNKWEKEGKVSYFTTLVSWKIEAVGGQAVSSGVPSADDGKVFENTSPVMDTDIPFKPRY